MIRQETGQCTEIEDDPATTQSDFCMRTTLIRLINNIALISQLKIKTGVKKNGNQEKKQVLIINLLQGVNFLLTRS